MNTWSQQEGEIRSYRESESPFFLRPPVTPYFLSPLECSERKIASIRVSSTRETKSGQRKEARASRLSYYKNPVSLRDRKTNYARGIETGFDSLLGISWVSDMTGWKDSQAFKIKTGLDGRARIVHQNAKELRY